MTSARRIRMPPSTRRCSERPHSRRSISTGIATAVSTSLVVADAERHLAPGSRMDIIQGVGHFPHLEWAVAVNERILAWVGKQYP